MPEASGLPEGIPEAELKARFGGVGGAPYLALVADIEGRLARLPVYAAP